MSMTLIKLIQHLLTNYLDTNRERETCGVNYNHSSVFYMTHQMSFKHHKIYFITLNNN